MRRARGRRGLAQSQGRTQKQTALVATDDKGPINRRGGGGRGGSRGAVLEREAHSQTEWEQRLKGLQLPAACSFVLGQVERYLRSASRPDTSSSLPSRETLLMLIDRFILKLPVSPPSHKRAGKDPKIKGLAVFKLSETNLNVFEEMELLDLLRTQLEERQSRAMQHALFDAMFSYQDNEVTAQRQQLLQKLTSLAVSLGSSSILNSAAVWMELYPAGGRQLASYLYHEFCYLLPAATEPMRQLSTLSPPIVKQLLISFTDLYPFHKVSQKPSVKHSPPLLLVELVSHWINTTNPGLLFSSSSIMTTELCETPLLRYAHPKPSSSMTSLAGLMQWCVLEPLLSDETVQAVVGRREKEDEAKRVESYRALFSMIHANLLGILLELTQQNHCIVTSVAVNRIVETLVSCTRARKSTSTESSSLIAETSLDRLAQFLQIGLSVGAISLHKDDIRSIASSVPQNRLLSLVISHHTLTDLK